MVVVVAMCTHDRLYEGFFPSYVDHHGLLSVAVFGMMLGAIFMGGGWWRAPGTRTHTVLPGSPDQVRNAAVFSALCGACGLWVSAASVIPPIAIAGVTGLLVAILHGRAAVESGAQFDPQSWRLWGRVGATMSMVFYLLEYFPNHLGLRLEPNHPLHAIAWLGGGELIAQAGERWLLPAGRRWRNWQQLIWPALAVSAAPLVVAVGGSKVFVLLDPFMSRLHSDYIQEFQSMWTTIRPLPGSAIFQVLGITSIPLVAALATMLYRRTEVSVTLWFAFYVTLLVTAMAWWQARWMLNASGPQICLVLVLLAVWTTGSRASIRWIAALAMVGLLYVPSGVKRMQGVVEDLRIRRVLPKDANNSLYRDIAAVLRASQPEGEIVMLASPNASTGIGYYGRFRTLGTLYWENIEGLKAAASILGARTDVEAATLIQKHGVTHIALLMEENFIAPYYKLLHPQATDEELRKGFGHQLLLDRVVPQWLQMIPYKAPDDLVSLKASVMLFKVNFRQSVPDALYNVAMTQIVDGLAEPAERTLDLLLKQAPGHAQALLRKAELLMVRKDWAAAADHYIKGISLLPAAERPAQYRAAADSLYYQKQHGLAIRLYRAAFADQPTADVACFLAWILATSTDDSLRNGKEALQLTEAALTTDPSSPTYLNAHAGALAELGRFKEAIETSHKALANAKLRGETAWIAPTEQRIAVFQAGKPMRK
jgi:tetratricopeptide (TPR) repeat protein